MSQRSRITTRLALVNAVSASLALLLSSLLMLELTRSQLQVDFEKRILTQTELVASTLGAAILFEDRDTADELTRSLFIDAAVCSAFVRNNEQELLVDISQPCAESSEPGDKKGLFQKALELFGSGALVAMRSSIEVASQSEGVLTVQATNQEVYDSLVGIFWKIMSTTLGALVLVVWFTMRGQGRLVKPVMLLSATVDKVRKTGNYGLRSPVFGSDEVSQLASDVNSMLELIDERDQFLAREVEAGVRVLKYKNEELENEIRRRSETDRALEESRQRFANAFQNAPIGMAITDRSGEIIQANEAINSLLETSCKGRKVQDFMSPSRAKKFFQAFRSVLRSRGSSIKEQHKIRSQTGVELTCNLALSALPDPHGVLSHCIVQVEDVTKAAELAAELEFQAQHDVLTGLGNRRVLETVLRDANELAEETPFSIALLDLDQFKIVNDTCGHEAGDKLLVDVARLLKEVVREEDTVVRLGGDEFALLLHDCLQEDALVVAEKIRTGVENLVFLWEGKSFRIGVSIGLLTVSFPLPDASEILRQADAACFVAKDAGRNRVHQVREDDQTLAKAHGEMHWVSRIQNALDNDEFVLYAQPVVPLQPSVGRPRMEILLRLRDYEKRRLIPPGAFLPAVERYGLSGRLDRWVVTSLLKQVKAYSQVFDDDRCYWINLSGQSLSDPVFLEFLLEEIAEANLSKGAINFEVTETAVISNMVAATEAMKKLQALGCKFALDDFGAGVSTFGYLRDLPIDFVKIDGSFVKNIRSDEADRIFVKSVIDIVAVLNIRTVVEFVEDEDTARLLTMMGADYGQGFGLGRPAPLLPEPAYQSIKDGLTG